MAVDETTLPHSHQIKSGLEERVPASLPTLTHDISVPLVHSVSNTSSAKLPPSSRPVSAHTMNSSTSKLSLPTLTINVPITQAYHSGSSVPSIPTKR